MVVKGGAKFVGNGGGLYASFVRGECLSGTITPEDGERGNEAGIIKKRRDGGERKETKEEQKARKAVRRARSLQEAVIEKELAKEVEDQRVKRIETKAERSERKRKKRLLRVAEREATEKAKKKKKKKRRND